MVYNFKTTAGVATQLVFEYPGWGAEHVSDMYSTYEECGDEPPCEFYTFEDACAYAQKYKDQGLNYSEVQEKILKNEKEIVRA